MIKNLKNNDLMTEIKDKNLVLVDFFADWCNPCQMLKKELEMLDANTSLEIIKINIDELEDLASDYDISSIPTLLLFKNGELLDKKIGYFPYENLLEWVKIYE
ncbi:TPA: thioredoxin family protein [Candidatus Avacholeplasma faecigallinarum]|nr:thioredoxin family protein [Candidatus Avacholeplasma faecigallinarum]